MRRAALVCVMLSLASCANHRAPAAPLPKRGVATCSFESRVAIAAGERLRLGEDGAVEAHLTGYEVHVRIEGIDTTKEPVASATVRAPPSPPALMLYAKLRADALPLRAARDVVGADGRVVITRGASVAIVSGDGNALALRRRGDGGGVLSPASCEDVELGGDAPARRDDACSAPKGCPDEKGGPFHARRKVAVRDRPSPEGQPLGWLEEDGEVRIVGHQGSYARVEALRGEIAAPAAGFWIDEATLDPRAP